MKKDSKDKVKRARYEGHVGKFFPWVGANNVEGKSSLNKKFFNSQISLGNLLYLVGFCSLLSFLVVYDYRSDLKLNLGDKAPADVFSPTSFELVDDDETLKKQSEAENKQLRVFDFDISINGQLDLNLKKANLFIKQEYTNRFEAAKVSKEEKESFIEDVFLEYKKVLGRNISEDSFRWLFNNDFKKEHEDFVIEAIKFWRTEKLISNMADFIKPGEQQITYVSLSTPDKDRVLDLFYVKDLQKLDQFSFSSFDGYDSFNTKEKNFLSALVLQLLVPNLTLNKSATAERKKKSKESVLPVSISVKKGQPFLKSGQVVDKIHLSIFEKIKQRESRKTRNVRAIATALIFLLLIYSFYNYISSFSFRKVGFDANDIVIFGVITAMMALMTKFMIWFVESLLTIKYALDMPQSFLMAMIPVSAGAMFASVLVRRAEVVWFFCLFLSLVLGYFVEFKFSFIIYAIISSFVAAKGASNLQSRNAIYKTGLIVGLVNVLTLFLVYTAVDFGEATYLRNILWVMPTGFFSGIFCSVLTMIFVPIFESLFNTTTDLKLLELSNLNHPVIKDMFVKAPGTYHHALVVGTMCEAAGEAIGANQLLAKVMAYYHDIGKMEHAEYFVENQRPNYNPHDNISPYMSKTILVAHVKDGAELGLKSKLGKPIIDGILQHHGTSLISFFFNKAKESSQGDINHATKSVAEEEFRYPGPKPQFIEAGLVMLADSVEAAARSIDEPTPIRIKNLVDSIIKYKYEDGQLDECDLTLKDLRLIKDSFNRILLAVYHHRIKYPDDVNKVARLETKKKLKNNKNPIGTS